MNRTCYCTCCHRRPAVHLFEYGGHRVAMCDVCYLERDGRGTGYVSLDIPNTCFTIIGAVATVIYAITGPFWWSIACGLGTLAVATGIFKETKG